jgi:sortase A
MPLWPDQAGTTAVMVFFRQLERWFLVLGTVLLAVYVAFLLDRTVVSRLYLSGFSSVQADSSPEHLRTSGRRWIIGSQQWSNERLAAYRRTLSRRLAIPTVAVLRIPQVNLVAPVLEGTDDFALNRGVGHIRGTAGPNDAGNFAIAGHRDGFFRALKDVSIGDAVEIELRDRLVLYRVTNTSIVNPTDVSVLKDHTAPTLTLVTCYPFYFIGSAPKRFIVEAVRAGSVPLHHSSAVSAQIVPRSAVTNVIPRTAKPIKETIQ